MTAQPVLKVVVEGPDDARLLRALAGRELAGRLRVFAAQGLASLATVGRNILFDEGGPVLVVMDSETLDPQLSRELQGLTAAALSWPLTSGVPIPRDAESAPPFKVFAFVPEIEVVFFEAPQALDRLLGKATPQEKVKDGLLVPKPTLLELLKNGRPHRDYQSLLEDMDPQVQEAIASGRQAKALRATIESMLASPAKA
jgi:hypothetical protein